MATEQNKEIVQQIGEAANQGIDAWLSMHQKVYSPNMIAHFPAGIPPLNYEMHEQFQMMLYAAFADVHYTLDDLIAEGDRVAARWTASSTHTGEFQGIAPTGKSSTIGGISIFRLVDGQVVEEWISYDNLGLMQQLGVVPAPETIRT